MHNFTQPISDRIPKSWDDIICKNRYQACISITSKAKISELQDIVELGLIKDILNHWTLVSINVPAMEICYVTLLGNRPNGEPRVTSPVLKIDLNAKLVKTTSGSIYQLDKPLVGEPLIHKLMLVCLALHTTVVGEYLGIPHLFY